MAMTCSYLTRAFSFSWKKLISSRQGSLSWPYAWRNATRIPRLNVSGRWMMSQPPSSMHDVDYADVLGKKPIVLLFATPALCSSRVCGPVVDIAEEVKSERPDDAAYIHMEIYNDNDPNKGPRPQVEDFNLPSEPWLFVIDSDGKVSTAIEGAFSKQELEDAIDKADADSGVSPS